MTTKARGHRKHTPVVSKRQQRAMGTAYGAKKGTTSPSKLRGPAKKMYKSMSRTQLKSHLKESKGKNLPIKSR